MCIREEKREGGREKENPKSKCFALRDKLQWENYRFKRWGDLGVAAWRGSLDIRVRTELGFDS